MRESCSARCFVGRIWVVGNLLPIEFTFGVFEVVGHELVGLFDQLLVVSLFLRRGKLGHVDSVGFGAVEASASYEIAVFFDFA